MRRDAPFNVLVSSCGRRVGLVDCFREALAAVGLEGAVYGIDSSPAAPAFHLVKRAGLVPRCTDPTFVPAVLELCRANRVDLVVPTIDPELAVFASAREVFAAAGVAVAISSDEAVRICGDKLLTHQWLVATGAPTVGQYSIPDVVRDPDRYSFPLIVKPRFGSASLGVRRVASAEELGLLVHLDGLIAQEMVSGAEYTINAYVDRTGRCVSAVPHRRSEVRAGEVSKGLTVKDPRLMALGAKIAEALPGAWGALNIQCFLEPAGTMRVIEINARFGGGYPLTQRAGAWFTRWLIEETLGLPLSASFDDWQDDLAMLRYDEAVYLPGSRIREGSREPLVPCI